jgi:hypothetical protein
MIRPGKVQLNRPSSEVVKKICSEREHIQVMLKILRASKLTTISNKKIKITMLPILSEMLKGTTSLSALFVAYPNDDFFLYKKATLKALLEQYNAPQSSYFMMTLRQSKKTIHHFYDKNINLLKMVDDPAYHLQIEARPWYKNAKSNNDFTLTDAYLFNSSKEYGVTLAVEEGLFDTFKSILEIYQSGLAYAFKH